MVNQNVHPLIHNATTVTQLSNLDDHLQLPLHHEKCWQTKLYSKSSWSSERTLHSQRIRVFSGQHGVRTRNVMQHERSTIRTTSDTAGFMSPRVDIQQLHGSWHIGHVFVGQSEKSSTHVWRDECCIQPSQKVDLVCERLRGGNVLGWQNQCWLGSRFTARLHVRDWRFLWLGATVKGFDSS